MSPPQEQDPRLPAVDPLPGRVIAGNFRVGALIGSGAMGNVYRAEQLSLGKAVAVKVLHAHLKSDEKLVMRFKREAKSASLLNHPHSVQIIDSGQEADGTLYIAMELLDGRDLAQVLRDDFPLPLPRVVKIMAQVLEALDEAHAQNIVHRDLKPSNIMLIERRGERDYVKVCDFGIAKAMSGEGKDRGGNDKDGQAMLTIEGLVCGTPEYMAPEQARAEALDGRADLYAAAVILYQLMTGDIPFRADSPIGIVSRHLAEAPIAPSRRRPDLPIPSSIDEIVLRGMEKQRELRFPNALALREALLATVGPMGAGPMTPYPPGVRAALASMPTTPRMGSAAATPTRVGGDRGEATADLPRRAPRLAASTVAAVSVGLAVGALAVVLALRPRTPVAVAPAAPAAAAAAAPAVAPPPAAAAAPPPALPPPAAPAPEPAPPTAAGPLPVAARERKPRKPSERHAVAEVGNVAPVSTPSGGGVAAPAPVAVAIPPPPAAAAPEPPAPHGARELLAEAEKLLGQGEPAAACARGEEAKRLNAKLAPVYKFLGKCYMRAGNAAVAKDNYRKYLELAPAAADAPFIKSMIK